MDTAAKGSKTPALQQQFMHPYGTPPPPYVAMYPHGGLYPHSSIPPTGFNYYQMDSSTVQVFSFHFFDQLELGPMRTLLYGAIAGACAEAATYPFEVVRRQLQMQVQATSLNAFATCAKIVEQGGVPALYAGLSPSLLQVLPSAAISYFVYEFMKIVLKVE